MPWSASEVLRPCASPAEPEHGDGGQRFRSPGDCTAATAQLRPSIPTSPSDLHHTHLCQSHPGCRWPVTSWASSTAPKSTRCKGKGWDIPQYSGVFQNNLEYSVPSLLQREKWAAGGQTQCLARPCPPPWCPACPMPANPFLTFASTCPVVFHPAMRDWFPGGS